MSVHSNCSKIFLLNKWVLPRPWRSYLETFSFQKSSKRFKDTRDHYVCLSSFGSLESSTLDASRVTIGRRKIPLWGWCQWVVYLLVSVSFISYPHLEVFGPAWLSPAVCPGCVHPLDWVGAKTLTACSQLGFHTGQIIASPSPEKKNQWDSVPWM